MNLDLTSPAAQSLHARTRHREALAAAACVWCGIPEHGGGCKTAWRKLAAEQAAQGRRLMVVDSARCPWCRRCVVRHRPNCPMVGQL